MVAEPFTQWVLEDTFPYGRPAFEDVGGTFVSNVAEFEALKLRLLNGSHQAVAYQGQLAGYTHVHEALSDPKIFSFLKNYMIQDVVPTLNIPSGFDVKQYIDTLLDRFSNSHVGDLLARLSQDSSSRIPKFVLPTVLDSLSQGTSHKFGTQVLASWLRYLTLGTNTNRFTLDDPQLTELANAVSAASSDPVEFLRQVPQLTALLSYPEFLEEFRNAYVDLSS